MKIGDKIQSNNSNAVIVAQAKDGTFIGDNGGNLFKVTSDWKKQYNCPWPVGTKIANNHGDFATVITEDEYHADLEQRRYSYNDVFDTLTEPFVIFKYSSGAFGWDPAKYWHEVKRVKVIPTNQGFKAGDIIRAKPDKTAAGFKGTIKVLTKNTGELLTDENTKEYSTMCRGYVVHFTPDWYEIDNSGQRYFEAYDSCARSWNSLSTEYKQKWNNLAAFIANEKKGD